MSASTRPGRSSIASATASSRVTATPVTSWPRSRTIVSISIAMIGSSSMISTRARVCFSISASASATSVFHLAGVDLDQIGGILGGEAFHARSAAAPGATAASCGRGAHAPPLRCPRRRSARSALHHRHWPRPRCPGTCDTGPAADRRRAGTGPAPRRSPPASRGHICRLGLAAGQGPAVAPQEGKVRCELLSKRHGSCSLPEILNGHPI